MSRPAVSAGVRSRATRMPSATACVGGAAGEHPAYLVTDGVDVGGALAQVGVGELATTARSMSARQPAQAANGADAGADPAACTSESISVSASSVRWASKMPASSAPTSRTVRARRCSMSRRTSATASATRRHSVAGSPTVGVVGRRPARPSAGAPGRSRCPGEAGRPARPRRSIRPGPGRGSWSSASSNRRAARASRCSTASCACGPEARTSTSWPSSAPRVATRLRLPAGTGPAPVVRLVSETVASRPPTSLTSRAAGRACRPCWLVTVKRPTTSSPPAARAARRARRRPGPDEVGGLAHQRGPGLGGDLGAAGAARGRDRGDDEPLDDRRRARARPGRGRSGRRAGRGPARR